MRITDLDKAVDGDLVRVTATVRWEDCDQPAKQIFIAAESRYADDLAANPHAFLTGVLIPALHFGERRIAMDAAVCPRLKQGLSTIMGLMHHWSEGRMKPLALEMGTRATIAYAGRPRRTGMFLSGGIDSLATLRLNQLHFPSGHPDRIQDGLLIHGFDIGGVPARGAKYHVFERAREHMQPVADDAGIELIPLYTNIRHLCDTRELWLNYFFGAVLAAAAHAFAPRLHAADIAASYDIPNLAPCGSHPLLDPSYGSADVQIRHCDVEVARLDKLRLIAEWPAAFHNFRVCLANVPDRLNCGRCEKCVRTMTGLVAIDALQITRAFVEDDVDPVWFEAFKITIRHREPFYRELLEPLRARGRHELAALIAAKLTEPPASAR
jgi:hypothetical protein